MTAMPELAMLRRALPLEVETQAETRRLRVIASTDTPVRRGRYEEVLEHTPEAITVAAKTVLLNHDPDKILGRVVNYQIVSGRLIADIELAPTQLGDEALRLVQGGFLQGASIGYTVEAYEEVERSQERVRVRVTRWTWRELSLTPVPADILAGVVRSYGAEAAETVFSAPVTTKKEAAVTTPVSTNTPPPSGQGQADWRAELVRTAQSLGVSADGLDAIETREAGLALLAQRKAALTTSTPKAAPTAPADVVVTRDGFEKAVDEALHMFAHGRRLSDIARRWSERTGGPKLDTDDLIDGVRKALLTLDTRGLIDADGHVQYRTINKSADFGSITQLAAAKAMHEGYMGYEPEYPKWVRELWVPDFNTVTVSGLGLSEFAPPTGGEGNAYPNTTLEISGGSGTNEFLGANFDVTLQALYNDRANIIMTTFRDIGRVGARTLDKITQVALEGANFSSASQALAFSETNLGTAYGAHAGVTIPGIPAKRLIVPMPLYVAAMNATLPAPGAQTGRVLAGSIEVVRGWFLTDTNDWYLCADPADAPVVVLLRHPDYPSPRLVTKGESGVASIGFRIDFPAKAIVLNRSTNRPLCAYKCTQT